MGADLVVVSVVLFGLNLKKGRTPPLAIFIYVNSSLLFFCQQAAAEAADCLARLAQRLVIQGIGDADVRPQAKGAAMHHGYIGLIQQRQGHVFIAAQQPPARRGAPDQRGA